MTEQRTEEEVEKTEVMTPRLWRREGWICRVIKNEDDDGWAVEMTREGDSEPSLVGPWTMGRDKKNPKPLDINAFHTLVKTANDVLIRAENQRRAQLHKVLTFTHRDGTRVHVTLDIVPDEDDPHAILCCINDYTHEELFKGRVVPNFRLNAANVERTMAGGD